MSELNFPTERIDLPSRGLPYAPDSELSKGYVEMKYMTAKEEDILTNANFIKQGVVIDKLLQSMVVTPIKYDELIVGDKNALLIAARILGYGKDYEFTYDGDKVTFDLTTLSPKPIDTSILKPGVNDFTFTIPSSGTPITFKLLTNADQKNIDKEVAGLKKINPQSSAEVSTRLKHTITSVNGNREAAVVRAFAENILASDIRALSKYAASITPDIEFKVDIIKDNGDVLEGVTLPILVNFFWPDAGV